MLQVRVLYIYRQYTALGGANEGNNSLTKLYPIIVMPVVHISIHTTVLLDLYGVSTKSAESQKFSTMVQNKLVYVTILPPKFNELKYIFNSMLIQYRFVYMHCYFRNQPCFGSNYAIIGFIHE